MKFFLHPVIAILLFVFASPTSAASGHGGIFPGSSLAKNNALAKVVDSLPTIHDVHSKLTSAHHRILSSEVTLDSSDVTFDTGAFDAICKLYEISLVIGGEDGDVICDCNENSMLIDCEFIMSNTDMCKEGSLLHSFLDEYCAATFTVKVDFRPVVDNGKPVQQFFEALESFEMCIWYDHTRLEKDCDSVYRNGCVKFGYSDATGTPDTCQVKFLGDQGLQVSVENPSLTASDRTLTQCTSCDVCNDKSGYDIDCNNIQPDAETSGCKHWDDNEDFFQDFSIKTDMATVLKNNKLAASGGGGGTFAGTWKVAIGMAGLGALLVMI